jgi:hypothetical protein
VVRRLLLLIAVSLFLYTTAQAGEKEPTAIIELGGVWPLHLLHLLAAASGTAAVGVIADVT